MTHRIFIGLTTMKAAPGEIFFCSHCLKHSQEITVHNFAEMDSNDDVSFDGWEDECPLCGYVGVLVEKTITRLIRFQIWSAGRRNEWRKKHRSRSANA